MNKKQKNHLINLLNDVLQICRCKSSVSINRWQNLRLDIERAVNDAILEDDKVVINKTERIIIKNPKSDITKLIDDNKRLREDVKYLKLENYKIMNENKKLTQLERGIISLLTQKNKTH